MTNLTRLYLEANEITDIGSVADLVNLKKLVLAGNEIASILALVDNPGLGVGDSVSVYSNYLDLTPGSADMLNIQILQSRGVDVDFEPQN